LVSLENIIVNDESIVEVLLKYIARNKVQASKIINRHYKSNKNDRIKLYEEYQQKLYIDDIKEQLSNKPNNKPNNINSLLTGLDIISLSYLQQIIKEDTSIAKVLLKYIAANKHQAIIILEKYYQSNAINRGKMYKEYKQYLNNLNKSSLTMLNRKLMMHIDNKIKIAKDLKINKIKELQKYLGNTNDNTFLLNDKTLLLNDKTLLSKNISQLSALELSLKKKIKELSKEKIQQIQNDIKELIKTNLGVTNKDIQNINFNIDNLLLLELKYELSPKSINDKIKMSNIRYLNTNQKKNEYKKSLIIKILKQYLNGSQFNLLNKKLNNNITKRRMMSNQHKKIEQYKSKLVDDIIQIMGNESQEIINNLSLLNIETLRGMKSRLQQPKGLFSSMKKFFRTKPPQKVEQQSVKTPELSL
jgi:hypothetical protein